MGQRPEHKDNYIKPHRYNDIKIFKIDPWENINIFLILSESLAAYGIGFKFYV